MTPLQTFRRPWPVLASAALAVAVNLPARGQAVPADAPYKNLNLSFAERAAHLVKRMTLEEKAQQLRSAAPANPRLDIQAVNWWTEAIHGVSRAGTATVFPQAMSMAATWDPPLLQQVGDAIADEARAKYRPAAQYQGIIIWSPTINMARDPRWGRTEETYGEDPFLTGKLAVGFIRGLQGDDPKYLKTVATPKHFALHSQESGRQNRSFDCPEAVLRDYYLPAFRDAIVDGKAMSIMSAFSGINKVPDSANFWLLNTVLRKEWGFEGAVTTDWGAVRWLVAGHHYANTDEEAVADAVNAGVDVVADSRDVAPYIVAAVNQKLLKQETLDRALTRNLMLRFRLGFFDPPEKVPFSKIPASVVGSKEHIALAAKVARESVVLLKNGSAPAGYGFSNLLPIDLRRVSSIAVLGPYADISQYGNYSGTPASPQVTIVKALRAAVGDRVIVRSAGAGDDAGAVRAAAASDVVIYVCGLNSQIEKEGTDRPSLRLPDEQQNLLERIVKANPVVVALVEGGSAVGLQWMKENVPAVAWIGYPGEQGSATIAQITLGQVNPSGRLPLTFYRANDDLPPLDDYDITKGRTYMYLTKPAPYVFGHGLSYTAFDYRNLKVTPSKADAVGTITVTLDIANTGTLDGDEVVQLYVHEKQSESKRPIKQLKGFQRITVTKGESKTVTFVLPVSSLAFWNTEAKKYVVEPGGYEILVGASSADIRSKADVIIQ